MIGFLLRVVRHRWKWGVVSRYDMARMFGETRDLNPFGYGGIFRLNSWRESWRTVRYEDSIRPAIKAWEDEQRRYWL